MLLADEPTGNLDTANGAEVMAILDRLNAGGGVAVVLVTHEAEVAAHARRQIHVRDGVIERIDVRDGPIERTGVRDGSTGRADGQDGR